MPVASGHCGYFAAKIPPLATFGLDLAVTLNTSSKNNDLAKLDAATAGAFSAATAGERAARIREWLSRGPDPDQLAEVFKELSTKDKGAAKLVRERLDEAKRAKGQEALAQEWAHKAQAFLAAGKINIADAMAWQRDAAKAGAPLSKEPLAQLKTQLAERVRAIEDLQHQVQVQREAAVLLAQRIEVLSTKPFAEAQSALTSLQDDVAHWQQQASNLVANASWPSVDAKFPPLLEASRGQLLVVWEAFSAALALAITAANDPAAALPPVPVWADELRRARGVAPEPSAKPVKPTVDPQVRLAANAAVQSVLEKLEAEVAQGHGKATASAAAAVRQALKEHGKLVDDKLESRAHAALAAAGELEGWQRWRADQLREELLGKAQALLNRPPGQAIGGRKMQDHLRGLREQWKLTDQGGVPNHALWKRFDEACNEAHKVVEAWLVQAKAEAAQNRAERLALIEEVRQWASQNRTALDGDWKGFHRLLHQFGDRWREGGHVGEKVFAELQPQWKEAIAFAAAPLEEAQAQSQIQRHAMVEEARQLGGAAVLRLDAVRALQQRWQAEAQRVPVDRRLEQKLWDAFRKPIDDAFARKSAERERAQAALSGRDRAVLDAARAVELANASGDAVQIRAALAAMDAALKGQAQAQLDAKAASEGELVANAESVAAPAQGEPAAQPAPPATVQRKPVVAVRGDDRPGKRTDTALATASRPSKWGAQKEAGRAGRHERGQTGVAQEGVRLGDAAFRAQRDALEHAQAALRKLAVQAHGEAIGQLTAAWERRDPALLATQQELGARVKSGTRAAWARALGAVVGSEVSAGEHLLRLEMAAEVPTPAKHMAARRAMQLQLLTRRHDPAPAVTWEQDVGAVLAGTYSAESARRMQAVLRVLLRS